MASECVVLFKSIVSGFKILENERRREMWRQIREKATTKKASSYSTSVRRKYGRR